MKNITFLLCLFIIFLTPFIAKGAIVINEVLYDPSSSTDTGKEYIRLYNNGDSAIDLTGYELNAVSGDYYAFPSFSLSPKSFITVRWRKDGTNGQTDLYTGTSGYDTNMGNTTGWVALFKNNEHTKNSIIDYLEYGAGGQTYESKAVDAGIWAAGDFISDVEAGYVIKLKTDGVDNNSSSDWMGATPSIIQEEGSSSQQQATTQQISTNNQPPIAEAGDNLIAFIDDEITFDGSRSHDPDGFDLAYEWNLGEGEVKNDVIVAHKYSYPGTYLVTLTVFDGRYYSKDTITVEIYPKKITINEFLPSPTGKDEEEEWTELYNDSDQIIDISDWQLDDEEGGSEAFVFPENTLIAPKNYLIFPRPTTKIALNNDKGKVRLLLSTGVIFQEISYEKAPQGQSSARTPEGFVWSMPTPGLPNIIGAGNKQVSYNQTFQPETTGYPSENLAINYQSDKNQINGGWTYLPQQNSQEKFSGNLLANLEQSSEKINYKLILIIAIVIIVGLIIGIIVAKLKKKL